MQQIKECYLKDLKKKMKMLIISKMGMVTIFDKILFSHI